MAFGSRLAVKPARLVARFSEYDLARRAQATQEDPWHLWLSIGNSWIVFPLAFYAGDSTRVHFLASLIGGEHLTVERPNSPDLLTFLMCFKCVFKLVF